MITKKCNTDNALMIALQLQAKLLMYITFYQMFYLLKYLRVPSRQQLTA